MNKGIENMKPTTEIVLCILLVGIAIFLLFTSSAEGKELYEIDNRSYAQIMPGYEDPANKWFICKDSQVRYQFSFSEKAYWYKNIFLQKENDLTWTISRNGDCS